MKTHLVAGLSTGILLFCAQVHAVSIVTDGLVAGYEFNGNANDVKGNANGIVHGATLTTDRFGRANSAYAFDGKCPSGERV